MKEVLVTMAWTLGVGGILAWGLDALSNAGWFG